MKRLVCAIACVLTLAAAGAVTPASADLIVNGGFETGNFSGWTLGDPSDPFTFVSGCNFDEGCHSGNYYAALGTIGFDNTLSQTISDTTGQSLHLSFWLASDGGTPNDFSVDWNGAQLMSQTNIPAHGYIKYSFSVLATGVDTLMFAFRNDPGYLGLDDVSLTPGTGVPEPGSLLLLGTALVGAAGALRRRKKAAKA